MSLAFSIAGFLLTAFDAAYELPSELRPIVGCICAHALPAENSGEINQPKNIFGFVNTQWCRMRGRVPPTGTSDGVWFSRYGGPVGCGFAFVKSGIFYFTIIFLISFLLCAIAGIIPQIIRQLRKS
jgi:hypothetical protein